MSRSAEYRAKLRRVLEDLKIDAFLVPHEDRFLSEYTAPGSARLWLHHRIHRICRARAHQRQIH